MFRIISSSRYHDLLRTERDHTILLSKISTSYRWLSEFVHLEPLWKWMLNSEGGYDISVIRDEMRREYDAELSREGYRKSN